MVHWGTESCDPPTPTDDMDGYWRGLLIDSAGMIGLSRVTEDNIEEWLWRFELLRRLGMEDAGCLVYGKAGKLNYRQITPANLRRWVGLWTNWPTVTRHAFVKYRYEELEQRCDVAVRVALAAKPATPRHGKAKGKKKRRVRA